MSFKKPCHDIKLINQSGIPIPNILLKILLHVKNPQLFHLIFFIYRLDNQYRHSFQLWYRWHILTLQNISQDFILLSHETLLILTHLFFFANVVLIKGCVISPNVVFVFFYLFFELFINMQIWINHTSNLRLINTFTCFFKPNKKFIHM